MAGAKSKDEYNWLWPAYRRSDERWHVIGHALTLIREERDMTAAEVAARAEISRPYLTQIEKGARRPPEQVVRRILKALFATDFDLDTAAERTGRLIPAAVRQSLGLKTHADGSVTVDPTRFAAPRKQNPRLYALRAIMTIAAALRPGDLELLHAYASGLAKRRAAGSTQAEATETAAD